jgi:hypothetical protein
MTNAILLKIAALATPNSYRLVTINPKTHKESTLVEVLECSPVLVVDRAYALAAERGLSVMAHVVDTNALMA